MPDWRRVAVAAGVAAAGVAAGYAMERTVFRGRLRAVHALEPLEVLHGETREVAGPDGTSLHVEIHGPPAGPDVAEVVLVHGFTMTTDFWHEQIRALSNRLRIIVYDQPGHGRSTAPSGGVWSIDLLADALSAIVRETTTAGEVLLVGHSMGGMSILGFARRHPEVFEDRVGGLLLISTTAKAGLEDVAVGYGIQALVRLRTHFERAAGMLGPRARRVAERYRATSDLSFALAKAIGFEPFADPRHVDLAERLVLNTALDTVLELTPVLLGLDEDETLAAIDVPTVIAVGAKDRLTPAEHARHMAQVNPDVDLVEIPAIGHMAPLTAATTINALIVRLVGELTPAPTY